MPRIESQSVRQTREAGAVAAATARSGDVIALIGALGAGKTEFVRGFVAHLTNHAEVHSPTFTLVNSYDTPAFAVHHFDFYRLKSAAELIEIGFEEYLWSGGVCLVEWADLFPGALPPHATAIRFTDGENGIRIIEMPQPQ
jgi:tRNA threonylcarbamoyladenosine biosynthesis protein TsaE